MARGDRERWDTRYALAAEMQAPGQRGPSPWLVELCQEGGPLWRSGGAALDLACGRGEALLWLAERGFEGVGIDVSPVALASARAAADARGLAGRVRWIEADLDTWEPGPQPYDVVLSLRFFAPARLPVLQRSVALGGLFVAEVLTREASPRYGAAPGELAAAFSGWDALATQTDGRFDRAVFRRRA